MQWEPIKAFRRKNLQAFVLAQQTTSNAFGQQRTEWAIIEDKGSGPTIIHPHGMDEESAHTAYERLADACRDSDVVLLDEWSAY